MAEILNIDPGILGSIGASAGAILVSLRNFLELRQGAIVKPIKIVNYGLWSIKHDGKLNKALIIPVLLNNNGSKIGMVTNVKINFTGSKGTKEMEIRRKVFLVPLSIARLRTININEFRDQGLEEINPFYPIHVNAKESTSVIVECWDGNDTIVLDELMQCSIEIEYDNDKIERVDFPFKLSTDEYEKARDHIVWQKLS